MVINKKLPVWVYCELDKAILELKWNKELQLFVSSILISTNHYDLDFKIFKPIHGLTYSEDFTEEKEYMKEISALTVKQKHIAFISIFGKMKRA